MINKKGILFVLSSPSGAGKTTLCKKILSLDKNLRMSISYTTRPKRRSEKNGKDYYFISNDEFLKKKINMNLSKQLLFLKIIMERPRNSSKKVSAKDWI